MWYRYVILCLVLMLVVQYSFYCRNYKLSVFCFHPRSRRIAENPLLSPTRKRRFYEVTTGAVDQTTTDHRSRASRQDPVQVWGQNSNPKCGKTPNFYTPVKWTSVTNVKSWKVHLPESKRPVALYSNILWYINLCFGHYNPRIYV